MQGRGQPVGAPTEETANNISVGYTESDPLGPQDSEKKDALLAGAFKMPEELAQAYSELKKRLEGTEGEEAAERDEKTATEEDDPGMPRKAGIDIPSETVAELKEKGVDINVYRREFERTGGLCDASYAKLEQAGYPRDVVDDFIQGQRVMAESQVKAVKDAVGGEEAFSRIAQWAAATLSEGEQKAYARILETADPDRITFAVQGLKARYDAANGTDPAVVVSGAAGPGNDGKSRFRSMAEVTTAMSDPRYAGDPAYRQDVEQKFLRSNF